ncbi:hypothetical protein BBJ28_00008512 [Nothophytophthora sp. Chile5]|nr:hypothetical protein BBJ28_00008512 [Nothophytophthora sp. Chile5]
MVCSSVSLLLRVDDQARLLTARHAYVCIPVEQEIQSTLDAWRYKHRMQDAIRHSQNLAREFPLAMIQPPRSSSSGPTGLSARRAVSHEERASRERFLHLLQQLDHEEYGEPSRKKLKKSHVLSLQKEDHARELKKHNLDIGRRLQKELSGRRDRRYGRGAFAGKVEKRSIAGGTNPIVSRMVRPHVFDEEEEKSRKRELPPELLEIVEDALHGGPMEQVLIQKYNVDITRRHLQCLLPIQWLNDEVINFYFQLMNDRDEALVEAGVLEKRSHFFNSFFYTKVSEKGYNFVNVRRWTRKVEFSLVGVTCAADRALGLPRETDLTPGSVCADHVLLYRYLRDEMEHKKKEKFNDEGWELVTTAPDTPQQSNGSDCGVFSCMFADYISQNKALTFSQKDMEFHRHRMVLHVTQGELPLDEEL